MTRLVISIAQRVRRLAPAIAIASLSLPASPGTMADDADRPHIEGLIEQIRSSRLERSRAVSVRDLEVDMGLGLLRLTEGVLVPATPVGDRTLELLFTGRAEFHLVPPDAIEAQQLELFTGRERLDVEVSAAVLFIGDRRIVDELLEDGAKANLAGEDAERAEAGFADWVEGEVRRGLGQEGALLKVALGDAPAQSGFLAWLRSEELGDFFYGLDPFQVEQVGLGQFVATELDEIEQHRAEKLIRRARREGRLSQFRLSQLGDWNTWISASLRDASGGPRPGADGFEPEHYELHAELAKGETEIAGRTRIDLVSGANGRRVVTLTLHPDLRVRSVRYVEGAELAWFRDDERLHVALDETVEAGGRISLEVAYDGVILDELDRGVYSMRDTRLWHPHVGTFDRATYEATLRWPKKHQLLASGQLVEQGEEDGIAWQRRVLEVPAFGFSFEYGAYDVRTSRAGHVDLTVAFSKMESNWDTGVKDEVVEKLGDALLHLEETFGPYPLDTLTVATVPRGYSQGFLSFVTLAHALVAMPRGNYWLVMDAATDYQGMRRQQRIETIAHELSHQWWGNMVGWYNYRDQWLSEALADFSATSFVAGANERRSVYLASHARDWKSAVQRETEDGRSVESLGPVVLGSRLFSSYSDSAYTAVVYDKGSVIFSMLARVLGPDPFSEMLKALVGAVQNRAIDTETFLKAIERMSGVELDQFAEQYIYGTGVPEVYYRYKVEQAEDGWVVTGTARQIALAHYRYELVRDPDDRWNVLRERVPDTDIADRFVIAPFQIALESGRKETPRGNRRTSGSVTERGLGGQLLLEGETTEFSIPVAERPRHFWFDQRGEVLALFYGENHRPKRVLRYKAQELQGEEAEATLLQALSAELYSEAGLREVELSDKEIERQSGLEDVAILLDLCELYLIGGRDEEAREAFERAEATLGGLDKQRYRLTRTLLEARFDIRDGDFKSAYQQLSKNLALDLDRSSDDTVFDRARRKKFTRGYHLDADAYAMLALSAYQTDHEQIALAALEEAEERGCDMSSLREMIDPAAGDEARGPESPSERLFLTKRGPRGS